MIATALSVVATSVAVAPFKIKYHGAPVAQWVKRWPTDLAVVSSSPARGEDLFSCKRGSIAHSLSLSSAHRPDMTEILLKRT